MLTSDFKAREPHAFYYDAEAVEKRAAQTHWEFVPIYKEHLTVFEFAERYTEIRRVTTRYFKTCPVILAQDKETDEYCLFHFIAIGWHYWLLDSIYIA